MKNFSAEKIDWSNNEYLACLPSALKQVARSQELAQGDRLFRIDERPRAMFYVIKGEIRLTRSSRGGAEMILQRTRSGFLAEASVDTTTYHCDALAIEPSVILRFPMAKFRIALEDEKLFRKAWISLLAREVRSARARCERLTLKNAAERVLHFLENEGEHGFVTLEQSRKAWSAELGLSHEALYRTLAQMKKAGIIYIEGNTIQLLGA